MKKGEETRQKILDEAIVLFAESGYEKASMRELAGRVHIKAPSMYAYFSGKETLFVSVCDFVFGEYRRFIRRYAAGIRPMPAEEKLQGLMKMMNEYFYGTEEGRFLRRYFFAPPPQFEELFTNFYREGEDEMRKVIYEAVEREPEIFLSGATVTQAFICILDGMFFHMLNDSRQAYEEKFREVWKVFWNGIKR